MASVEDDNEAMEMSPETARRLFDNGGVLVVLNFPLGSVFGIDMKVYNTGTKFHGIKMIPPGVHFIYYNAVSKDGRTGPRSGFFHYFKSKEIVIRKWNAENEELSCETMSEAEAERVRNNLQELDPFLGAYPYQALKNWSRLTCNINEALLKKLQPECGVIQSVVQLIPQPFPRPPPAPTGEGTSSGRHQSLEDKYLPDMKQLPGTEIRFTKIPERRYPEGSTASEITRHNMDSTYMLEQLLDTYEQEEDILGELQLALVSFLVAHVYDAFEHWKRLLDILCSVDAGIVRHLSLLKTFLTILHYQIKEIPTDFFTDITSEDNVLVSILHVFFDNIKNSQAPAEFKAFVRKFRENLKKTYRWDFEQIPDDEQPVVVEVSVTLEE